MEFGDAREILIFECHYQEDMTLLFFPNTMIQIPNVNISRTSHIARKKNAFKAKKEAI
jgi:hypothetical protein